ncbi:Ig-like domain-containing protein [Mycolicibacterium gilvum]|uniref:Ig-like domain-containing protein n=1 Tax=Mycolicibacterium gilvum TaxID=1804 RepID=UPI001F25619D|nr:Ig-like domain-containing protein [Mycolicibacterium gilvum]
MALGVGTAVAFPHTALADEGAGSNGSVSSSSREPASGTTGTSDRESSSSPSKPAATRPSDSDDTETSGPDGDEPNADGSEPTEEDTEPSSTPATSPEPPADPVVEDTTDEALADPDPAESLAPSTLHPESGSTPEPVHSITATTVADLPTSAPPEEPASQPPRTDVPAAYPRTSPAIQAPASSVGALSTPVSQPVSLVGALVSTVLAPFSGGAPAAPSQPPLLWVVLAWVRRELQRTFANSTPTTTPQSVTLTLDSATSVSGPIEFDADDVDDDPLVYTVPGRGAVGGPTHGTVTVDQTTGTFTYNPDDAYALIGGTDTFTYTVSDAGARRTFFGIPLSRSATTATGIVTVTLNPVHVAPVTNGDTATTVEDRPVTIAVLDNDTDANGDALTVSGVTQGTSGTVTFTASGVTYTPNADFTGTDTFTYTATDGRSAGTATVTVTVTPVDDAPVAVGDSVTVGEDSGTTVIDVLANDIDVDGGPKVVTGVTPPAHGTVTAIGPSLSYTPAADFHGTDAFTYTLNDGSTATVTVIVTPVDDKPVAVGDTVTVAEDSSPTVIDVLANDTDIDAGPKTITGVSQPAKGNVVVTGTTVIYTPTADFTGTDTFTYTLNGGATATVTVTVTPVDDAPVAVGDTATVAEDSGPTIIDVLANDTDIDAGPIAITAVTQPVDGTVTFTASEVTYTPGADFHGTDTFTYTLNGGATATVTVTVTPVDDAPVTVGDAVTVAEDSGPTIIDVLVNDTDIDAGPKTITAVTQPVDGTVTFTPTGVTYTPNSDFHGTDTFTYTLNGGSVAVVTVIVDRVDDTPIAVGDSVTVAEDSGPTTIDVLANDTDIDNGPIAITAVTQPTNGTIDFTVSRVTYTPGANFHGTDTFTYTLNGGATATVTVTVNAAPVIGQVTTTPGEGNTWVVSVSADDAENDTLTTTVASADPTVPLTVTKQTDGTFQVVADPTWASAHPAAQIAVTVTVTDTYGSSATTTSAIGTAYNVISLGWDAAGVGHVPALPAGVSYTQVAGGAFHTVLLRSDGSVVGAGQNNYGQLDIPPLPAGVTYTQVAAGSWHTVLLRSDGTVVAVGDNFKGQIDIPEPGLGVSYTGVAAGELGTILLRSDGTAVAVGDGQYGQLEIPTLPTGVRYAQAAIGSVRSVLLRSDGTVVTVGMNDAVPTLPAGVTYIAVASGAGHAVLLRSDGVAVAFGANDWGQTDIPALPAGVVYVNIAASRYHSVLLRSDGTAVAVGQNTSEQLDIPVLPTGVTYTGVAAGGYSTWLISSTAAVPFNTPPVAANDTVTVAEGGTATISVTANDTDADGTIDTATVVITRQPTAGTVTIHAGGTVTYVSNGTEVTADSFAYRINDALGATSNEATVFITITPVDDAPVAVNDAVTVAEGGTITIAVIGNDTDADGTIDTTTVVIVTQPTAGTATVNGDGTVTYVSDGSEVTSDSFTYTVKDTAGLTSNVATVSITVNPVNDAPVAVNDAYTVAENGLLVIDAPGLLGNDLDSEHPFIYITTITNPRHGTFDGILSDGSFTYRPHAGYFGTDSFTYQINDVTGLTSNTATVTITITPVDDAPVAVNDAVTVAEDSGTTVIDVLANDTDIDAGPKTITSITQPNSGTTTITATGVAYTPNENFHGTDTFTYTLNGGTSAEVTVTVTPVNDAPVAPDKVVTISEDTWSVAIHLTDGATDVDGDPLRRGYVTYPAIGSTFVDSDNLGIQRLLRYYPPANYTGQITIPYTVWDGQVFSNWATITINVTPVNDVPVAVNDSAAVDAGGTTTITLTANDTDVDTDNGVDPATIVIGTQPSAGTVTVNSDGTVTYTSTGTTTTTDIFTYTVEDTTGLVSNPATVTVNVTATATPPVAVNDTVTVDEGGTTTLAVIANDTDADGDIDTATVVIVRQPTAGTATVNSDGTVSYASDGSEITTDSFEYTVRDVAGAVSNAATVIITVTPVDDAPVAVNDTVTITEDTLATFIDVLANDTDIDGGPKTITSITSPAGGHALVIGNRVRYFSAPNFHGTETFTYTLNGGATATVTVIVTPISEAPVIHRVTSTPGVGNTWVLSVDASDDDGGALTTTVTSANATVPLTITRLPGGAIQVDIDPTWARAHPGAQLPVTVTVTDAENISATKQLTIGTVSNAVFFGHNIYGQRNIPALPEGVTYTQVATASLSHTVLLRSDGTAVAVGDNFRGQLNIPPLPTGMTYTQVANGTEHTVLLRSDGTAIAVGNNSDGQLNIPRLPAGVTYTRIAAGNYGTVLLRSDGTAVGAGYNTYGQLNIPQPPPGVTYTQAAVGLTHTVLLRSDGTAVALGDNAFGQTVIPALPTGLKYTQVAAGDLHSVLLRSDGSVVAFGNNQWGQSTVPALPAGLRYTQVAAGRYNSMRLRSDGTAIGFGQNASSQLNIPVLPAGLVYTQAAASNHTVLLFSTSSSFNSLPLATNDAATVAEGGTITFSVTANDTDTDGTLNTATVVITRQPTSGSVTVNAGGTVTYVSNGAEVSADSFAYRVNDNKGATSNEATVSITITPVNDAPVAVDDAYTVAKNGVLVISAPGLLANDSDPEGNSFTIVAATGTQHGTVDPLYSNGSFTYRPAAGYSGTDTFTYTISDGTSTAQATVTIAVSAVDNQAPVAVADSYTVAEDGVLNVTGPGVLANDTDADGDPLSVVAAGPTSHGTFTLRSDGSFTYTPVANFHGTDSFTYQVSDGSGPSAPATATITVTPINDTPVVQNDTIPFPKDGFIGFSLANRSSDVDGDTLTATLISGTTHGTLFFDGTNRAFSYRPNTGFTGQDSFTYKVNDGKVDSAIATVTLNVS